MTDVNPPPRYRNWVDGARCEASPGFVFDLRSRVEPRRVLSQWPRSSAEDAHAAAEAARGASSWGEVPAAERRFLLERFARRLEEASPPGGLPGGGPGVTGGTGLEALLGLSPEEARSLEDRSREELSRFLVRAPIEQPAGAGLAVLVAHWTEGAGELLARCLEWLSRGAPVVLVSDARAPEACERLAAAAEEADLPPGIFGVLHDDTGSALDGLLGGELCALDGVGEPERARRLDSRLRDLARGGRPLEVRLRALRNSSWVVPERADPASEARSVVEKAFGRSSTLSGQLAGQVARVLCHELRFSRFTAEILEELERCTDVANPVPLINGDAQSAVRRAWALGLDEGAAIVFGGETAGHGEPGDGGPEATGHDRRAQTSPTVFTNVEPEQRLARIMRPEPVLSLLRISSDRVGRRLAEQLEEPGAFSPRLEPGGLES